MQDAREVADYFEVKLSDDGARNAYAKVVSKPSAFEDGLAREGWIDQPVDLTWEWQSTTSAPPDLVWTLYGTRLVSPKVREVFDTHRGPADELQWLEAGLLLPDGSTLDYWVVRFPTHVYLLDEEHTDWGKDRVPMRYSYSRERLAGHAVSIYAHFPRRVDLGGGRVIDVPSHTPGSKYVVSADVVNAMAAADITGARVTVAPVV